MHSQVLGAKPEEVEDPGTRALRIQTAMLRKLGGVDEIPLRLLEVKHEVHAMIKFLVMTWAYFLSEKVNFLTYIKGHTLLGSYIK